MVIVIIIIQYSYDIITMIILWYYDDIIMIQYNTVPCTIDIVLVVLIYYGDIWYGRTQYIIEGHGIGPFVSALPICWPLQNGEWPGTQMLLRDLDECLKLDLLGGTHHWKKS